VRKNHDKESRELARVLAYYWRIARRARGAQQLTGTAPRDSHKSEPVRCVLERLKIVAAEPRK
jgi:hypothetical protein